MRPKGQWMLTCVALLLSGLLGSSAYAVGDLHGHARFQKVKSDPGKGYYELYEYKAFLCKMGTSSDNWGYHCGDPGTADHPYTGCYIFEDMPAGTYSVMTHFGKFFPRGKVTSMVGIRNNEETQADSDEPIDYSGYYSKSSWDGTGSVTIFQTFKATGKSISRVSFAKADSCNNGSVEVSIHTGTGDVEDWAQVGPTRSVNRGGYGGDHWVAWDADQVQTTAGSTYAVKLVATSSDPMYLYWMNDSYYGDGTGYRGSQSNPAGKDYYIVVFSDNDGTRATMMQRDSSFGDLAGWKAGWAQSYNAKGTSFAGGVIFGSDGNWEWTATCSVHVGTPNGTQIGPTKTIHSVYAVSTAGCGGVSFCRGEVPTTPGNTYWLVYKVSGGWNVYKKGNFYSGGQASFWDGSNWNNQSYDLYMGLYEYDDTNGNLLVNPGAETDDFAGWITGGSPSGQPVIDPSTHVPNPTHHSGIHHFGLSVGYATANCYQYQTIPVDSSKTYDVGLYACHKDGTHEHVKVCWIDGTFGGTESTLYDIGPSGASTSWGEYDTQSFSPTGSVATIILRYLHDSASNIASIHVDDISVSEQSAANTSTNTATNTPTRTPTNTPTNTSQPPTDTPTNTPTQITIDDYFTSSSQFDANWTAYGTSPARYIKYEYWCSHMANLVEIQSTNGGYYRVFDEGASGGSYTVTVDRVRGYSSRYIRVDSNGGTNPNTYDKSWNSAGGNWTCETPSSLSGTIGSSGKITVFFGTTNNGQYEHLRVVLDPPTGPTNTPTNTPTASNTPTITPTSQCDRSAENIGSLTNMSFATSWDYSPPPQDPDGWTVLSWGTNMGPQYYTGYELSSGKPSNERCKFEMNGTGNDHIIYKEVNWGSATSVNVSAYSAGRKWDGSSNGTMSIGVDLNGCANSWSDADQSDSRTSNNETWSQLSLSNLSKPSGATQFTIMLRANRSGNNWNCQFDAVSCTSN